MSWPSAGLRAELRINGSGSNGNGYILELQAEKLARAVWIDFGNEDAEISDNALTLLPGEKRSLHIASKTSLATLRKSLSVRSLADVANVFSNHR